MKPKPLINVSKFAGEVTFDNLTAKQIKMINRHPRRCNSEVKKGFYFYFVEINNLVFMTDYIKARTPRKTRKAAK